MQCDLRGLSFVGGFTVRLWEARTYARVFRCVWMCVVGVARRGVWCDFGGATRMLSCARPTIGSQLVCVSVLAFGEFHLCLGELGAAPIASGSRVRPE